LHDFVRKHWLHTLLHIAALDGHFKVINLIDYACCVTSFFSAKAVAAKPSEALEGLPFTLFYCDTVISDPYSKVNHKPCAIISYIHIITFTVRI
jgi:hypothetical protein